MTNHAHLLITPAEKGQVGRMMQALGRAYVRYVNDRYHRTGTLWEGRYKSGPVQDDEHLLRCHRYIELNPVRAGMVAAPADHPWSSYAANALGRNDPLLTPHPRYLCLGPDAPSRHAAYREWISAAVPQEETDMIRKRLQRQHALGTDRFRTTIETQLKRRVGPAKLGRPPKQRPAPLKSAL